MIDGRVPAPRRGRRNIMATILYLTRIEFGAGLVARVAERLAEAGGRRPLLVSDRGIAAAGLFARLEKQFPEAPAFLDVPSNPTESAVMDALALYRDYECDSVVAIGGGSPIDLAKGVALLATHEGP